jgi:hypothetical protein
VSETKLSKSIRGALTAQGVWVIRIGTSNKRGKNYAKSGEPGIPDLCLPALGWLEVKLPGKPLQADQVAWHAKARKLGVNVEVAHSVLEALTIVSMWKLAAEGRTPLALVRP